MEARRRVDELEEKLQAQTAKLKRCREEFKTFAYIVSHDLRNPLINLKGFAAELRSALETIEPSLESALEEADAEQRAAVTAAVHDEIPEALQFIDSSVAQIDGFINGVLKLSRLSRRELRFEPLDMEALVKENLASLADEINERQAQVTVGDLPQVVADRASMALILEKLLENAVLYLSNDRPGEIEIAGERGPGETRFYVRDTGRGIAAEDMHKVFEPFRRAGRQDVPGEGLGLAYVQTLVRRHGGQIECQSEPGVGTTFAFTIARDLTEEPFLD